MPELVEVPRKEEVLNYSDHQFWTFRSTGGDFTVRIADCP